MLRRHGTLVLPLIVPLLICGCTSARRLQIDSPMDDTAQWLSVRQLASGTRVEVRIGSGGVERGQVQFVGDAALVIAGDDGKTATLDRSNIREIVQVMPTKRDSLKNGIAIGASIGAAYASIALALATRGSDSLETGQIVGGIAFSASLGAAIGAAIDRARVGPQRRVIFRRN